MKQKKFRGKKKEKLGKSFLSFRQVREFEFVCVCEFLAPQNCVGVDEA